MTRITSDIVDGKRPIRVVDPHSVSDRWRPGMGWVRQLRCESCSAMVERAVALPTMDGESYVCLPCLQDAVDRLTDSMRPETTD